MVDDTRVDINSFTIFISHYIDQIYNLVIK